MHPGFELTEGNAAAVAALCRGLEGLPLALELAAARAGVLAPAQMLERLSRRFDLLAVRHRDIAPRHRSLRAALDWSYQLLSPELQRFFARLSVFRGGFTLEAAEAVCSDFGFRAGARSAGPVPGSGRLDFGLSPTETADCPGPLLLPAIQNPKSPIPNPLGSTALKRG